MNNGTMPGGGLVKLAEECGELGTIAMKKLAYMDTDEHPDGKGSMTERLEEEMGDVLASMKHVAARHGLDWNIVLIRAQRKQRLYQQWENE